MGNGKCGCGVRNGNNLVVWSGIEDEMFDGQRGCNYRGMWEFRGMDGWTNDTEEIKK